MQTNQRMARKTVKFFHKKKYQIGILWLSLFFMMGVGFQNCSQPGQINIKQTDLASMSALSNPDLVAGNGGDSSSQPGAVTPPSSTPPVTGGGSSGGGTLDVCQGVSCNLDPLTDKVAVTTILLALGDEANNQLVIKGSSSQLIAETVIRYTTPVKNPKILIVEDHNIGGEDPEDTAYVRDVLLARYHAQLIVEPVEGMQLKDFDGYDLIWFNNPGHPMSSQVTYQSLLRFKGGVVLQGDDLSRGANFSMQDLTHLQYIDNGTSVKCKDKSFAIDNNTGAQYRITLDIAKMPTTDANSVNFYYGNDIDLTKAAASGVEILASAYGSDPSCTDARPAIVRYFK